MKHLQVVYLEWVDSETTHGWVSIDSSEVPLVYSIGVYLNETSEYVQLAHSIDHANDNANGTIKIPRVSIKKMRTLCQIQLKTK